MNDMVKAGVQALQAFETPAKAEISLLAQDQCGIPLVHHFGPGVAIREIFIPAGALLVGHKQKYDHLCVLVEGSLLVKLEENDDPMIVDAPALFVAKAGRKIMFGLEDCIFQNVYGTDLKDAASVEDHFIEKSDYWKEDDQLRFAVEQVKKAADREDYFRFLVQLGMNHDEFKAIVENSDDVIMVENGITQIKPSPIHGVGLYVTCPVPEGTVIMPALTGMKRTQAGRYVNHSQHPNCAMVRRPNGDIDLVAICDLKGCIGGNSGQELTVDYRHLFIFKQAQEA